MRGRPYGRGRCLIQINDCTEYTGYCDLRDICMSSNYATPNVPLKTLPDTSGALMSSLSGHAPDGYTPTGPALTGAISWAQQDLVSNPDHKAAIVLVTDGLPGGFVPGFPRRLARRPPSRAFRRSR